MKHLFAAVVATVFGCLVWVCVHYFGWLWTALGFIILVAATSIVFIVRLSKEEAPPPDQQQFRDDSAGVDLPRLLRNRPPASQRDHLSQTGRVIYLDLRPKMGGHSQPHTTQRNKLP